MKTFYPFFLLTILLLLFCFSCKRKSTELQPLNVELSEQKIIIEENVPLLPLLDSIENLSIPQEETSIQLSDVCFNYKYVQLETNPECLMGSIRKILVDDDLFFIFDKDNKILLSFHSDGKFYKKYGSIGRGPGEYLDISDFTINPTHNELYVLDKKAWKIVTYNYESNLLKETPLYYYFMQFEVMDNGYMVQYNGLFQNTAVPALDAHRLYISDATQQPLFKAFPYPISLRDKFYYEPVQPFQRTEENKIFYNHILSNTIWELCEDQCIARYKITFPEYETLFTDKELETLSNEAYEEKLSHCRAFSSNYLMNNQFLVGELTLKNRFVKQFLYDRKSKHLLYGTFSSEKNNDLFQHFFAGHFDYAMGENQLIRVIQPFEVFRIISDSKKYNMEPLYIGEKEQALLSRIKEEDNPVLVIFDMKSF